MCYCPTPTLHLNLALTGDGAFQLSPQKTHSVWFISILNYGDTENVLINHLLLVIPMSYPCHYTNLCPHKPHKHAHTHTHTHAHTRTHAHTHTRTHARTHAHTHTRTHAHTHRHTQTHTDTYIFEIIYNKTGDMNKVHRLGDSRWLYLTVEQYLDKAPCLWSPALSVRPQTTTRQIWWWSGRKAPPLVQSTLWGTWLLL